MGDVLTAEVKRGERAGRAANRQSERVSNTILTDFNYLFCARRDEIKSSCVGALQCCTGFVVLRRYVAGVRNAGL
jgi:hypothetical protein